MKRKLFSMNVLIVSLIVLIYTLSIILTVTYFNYQNFSQKISFDNQTSLSSDTFYIDNWFDNLMQFSSNLTSTSTIQDYLKKEGSSYAYFPEIYDELVATQQLNYQSNLRIGLTKSDDNKVVSHNGYYEVLDYLGFLNISEEQYTQFLNSPLEDQYAFKVFPHSVGDMSFVTLLEKKKYTQETNELITFMTFPISELSSSRQIANSALYLYQDNQLTLIDNNHFTLDEQVESIQSELSDLDQRELEVSEDPYALEEEDFTAYVSSSENINDLFLVQASSVSLSDLFTQDYVHYLALLVMILFFFGGAICLYTIRKVYSPIKLILSLISSKNSTSTIQESENFNELAFIESNIDSLYTENQHLKGIKQNSMKTMQTEFFIELLSGETILPIPKSVLIDKELGDYYNGGTLTLLMIEGVSLDESKFSKENLLTYRSKVLAIIASSSPTFTFKLVPLDYQSFCIILPEKNKEEVAKILKSIIPNIEKQLSKNITFSVATEVHAIESFKKAFEEVSKMMQEKFKYMNTQLIFPDNEEITDEEILPYTFEEERKLFNAVVENDIEKATEYCQSILDHLFLNKELNSFKITEFKIVLYNTIKRILNQRDISFQQFHNENRELFDRLSTISIDVIYATFQKLFMIIFDEVMYSDEMTSDPTTLKIIEYIKEHFTDDLSLTDLANKFNLSENYISRLLKKNADINFKAYTTDLKLAKSKKLLLEGKYNVTEISEMLGYRHVNTFIRTFKKHVGSSPGEYSKMKFE